MASFTASSFTNMLPDIQQAIGADFKNVEHIRGFIDGSHGRIDTCPECTNLDDYIKYEAAHSHTDVAAWTASASTAISVHQDFAQLGNLPVDPANIRHYRGPEASLDFLCGSGNYTAHSFHDFTGITDDGLTYAAAPATMEGGWKTQFVTDQSHHNFVVLTRGEGDDREMIAMSGGPTSRYDYFKTGDWLSIDGNLTYTLANNLGDPEMQVHGESNGGLRIAMLDSWIAGNVVGTSHIKFPTS